MTMQKQLPIGVQNFEKLIKGNKLYVDKTALIYKMTQEYNYVFLSRPRRFGKSLLTSTLEAYSLGYHLPFAVDSRPAILIGVNFSSEERTIEEWKVEEFTIHN